MKDFFISGNDIKICKTADECSLPIIIRREQFNNPNANSNNIITRKSSLGYIGDSYYDFDLNIKEDPNNGEAFDILRRIFLSDTNLTNNGFIKKSNIFTLKGISILEIADYGSQSLSPFFRDFVPHIFIDGKKIWQKYVSTIRHYSKRKMYILVKDNNNLNEIINRENFDKNLTIRICFKSRQEIAYKDRSSDQDTQLSITGMELTEFEFETSLLGTMGSFESPDYNSFFGNYLIGINEEGNEIEKFLSPLAIKEIKFEKLERTKDITKQGPYFNDISDGKYSENREKIKLKIILKEKIKPKNENKKITINIIPKTLFKEAIYITESNEKSLKENFSAECLNLVNLNVFKENGSYKIFDKDSESTEDVEIIPEYETTRKILVQAGSNITVQQMFDSIHKKHPTLFSWNSITNRYFAYDENGSLVGELNKDNIGTNIKYLLIYDNVLKKETTDNFINISDGETTDVSISFSTDKIMLKNSNINSTFIFNLNNALKYEDYVKVYFDKKDNDQHLGNILSFYAESEGQAPLLEKLNFIAINRSFPIKYEKNMIDNNTVLFKLPDYFIFNDILNTNEINPKINRNFLTGLEREMYVYINDDNLTEDELELLSNSEITKFYNVHKASENIANKSSYEKTRLVNINCINYTNRNIFE